MLTPGSLCKRQALQPISRLAGGSSQTQLLRLAQEILRAGRSSPHKWARDKRHPAWRPEQDAPRWAQVHTPSTWDEPASAGSAWERGTRRVGSAESRVAYSTPAARPTKTSLFSLSPPLPFNRGAPGQGVAASPAAHGGPCTARAMRVAHRYGRPWRARLGEGASRRQPLNTQSHDAWQGQGTRRLTLYSLASTNPHECARPAGPGGRLCPCPAPSQGAPGAI
jgi:hypothetical protein